jgi:hypothetical protein
MVEAIRFLPKRIGREDRIERHGFWAARRALDKIGPRENRASSKITAASRHETITDIEAGRLGIPSRVANK